MNPKGSVLRIVVAILFVLGIAAFFIPIVPYGTVTMSPADTGKDSTAMFDSEDKKEAEALEVLETGDSYSGFKLLGGLLKKDDLKPKFSMKLDDISDTLGVDIPKKVHVKFSLIIGILLIASLVVAAFAALTCFVGAFSSALKGKLTPILGILSIILLIATFVFLITGVGASDGGGKTKDVIAMGIFECSFAISWGGYVVGGVLLVGTVLAFIAAAQYSVVSVTGIEGYIYGISGVYANSSFPIEESEELIIGRDAAFAHIVLDIAGEQISRKHCSITYDADSDDYIITDFSSNGTYRNNGTRLASNMPVRLAAGSVIYLAKPTNSFRLG